MNLKKKYIYLKFEKKFNFISRVTRHIYLYNITLELLQFIVVNDGN